MADRSGVVRVVSRRAFFFSIRAQMDAFESNPGARYEIVDWSGHRGVDLLCRLVCAITLPTNIADDLAKKTKKIARNATFSLLFFGSLREHRSKVTLPTRRPVNVERRSHDPNPRTTASSALESRTRRTAHTAHTQSTMPHALAATSRPAMTVRAFEIAGTNARHTAWTLMARPRGFTARRVLRRALARDTMRAEHVSRARARTPRSRLARTRVRRTRTTDASRPESSASFLTAERRQPPRPASLGAPVLTGIPRTSNTAGGSSRALLRARRGGPHARSRARGRALMLRLRRIRCVTIVFCFPRRAFPAGQWRERIATTEERTRGVSSLDTGCYDSKRSHLHPNPPRTGTAGFARARTVVKVRPAGNRSRRRADASRRARKSSTASVQIGHADALAVWRFERFSRSIAADVRRSDV